MDVTHYPQLWRLYDHDRFVSTLRVESEDDASEILQYIMKARLACTHQLPGVCARVERMNDEQSNP